MSRIPVRFMSAAIVLSLCLSLVPFNSSQAAPSEPKISWSPCYREFGFPFECGTVQVPLDYSNPGKGTISIAVVRLPAGDTAQKIGSLFFNPGGPGGSGVDFVLFAGPYIYTEQVRQRFDLVGFDPRGIDTPGIPAPLPAHVQEEPPGGTDVQDASPGGMFLDPVQLPPEPLEEEILFAQIQVTSLCCTRFRCKHEDAEYASSRGVSWGS